jgi:hypothetical protein
MILTGAQALLGFQFVSSSLRDSRICPNVTRHSPRHAQRRGAREHAVSVVRFVTLVARWIERLCALRTTAARDLAAGGGGSGC